jgi:replication factor C small subunit
MNNTISIWAEKYRPQTLADYIGNKDLLEKIKSYIEKKDIPHLLFYGSAGTGKTTLSKIIANGFDCDLLYINASDENNVDNVRTKIKDFAANVGFAALKVVILDEADFLTQNSQAALRNIIETYSTTTRFIFTCNYIEKITEPIVSRCQCFEIFPMNKKDIAVYLKKILDLEGIKYTIDDIGYIINNYYPDIRKILNF